MIGGDFRTFSFGGRVEYMKGRETLAKEVIRWTKKRCSNEATVSIAGRK